MLEIAAASELSQRLCRYISFPWSARTRKNVSLMENMCDWIFAGTALYVCLLLLFFASAQNVTFHFTHKLLRKASHQKYLKFRAQLSFRKSREYFVWLRGRMPARCGMRILANLAIQLCVICLVWFFVALSAFPDDSQSFTFRPRGNLRQNFSLPSPIYDFLPNFLRQKNC